MTDAPDSALHHILAVSSETDSRNLVLKHADTFCVFDHAGDIEPGGLGEEGIYHRGTRHLSIWRLRIRDQRPFYLHSTVRDENDQILMALTNPDLLKEDSVTLPLGTLEIGVRTFAWNGVCHQELRVKNHGIAPVETEFAIEYGADYADIFEVRGMSRTARGVDLPPEVPPDGVLLSYRGLDERERRTRILFDPVPTAHDAGRARFVVQLRPREEWRLETRVACDTRDPPSPPQRFSEARREAEQELEQYRSGSVRLSTSNAQVDAWVARAASDVHMMTTQLPTGPYPYAGVPWFNTPFGRDGIVTALECLWMRPDLARGVLTYLAATQARELRADEDAEPGKILHETRDGEMANLKEMPFGRYYGTVDATPLFVALAGAYLERTGDRGFVEQIWPNIEAALAWIDEWGDADGDGFVEYRRRSRDGLVHQGWKDSDDAVFHADGTPATGSLAVCEVQGYVYAARRSGAAMAALSGRTELASRLDEAADRLRARFDEAFWCDELGAYALALDGEKRPCRVRSSNAGQVLFTGLALPERARIVGRTLLGPDFFSGWGVRTIAANEARYNPMAYHNGSVWPHDNALIAWGLARYDMVDLALRLWTGLFEAGHRFDLHRMPELFCGFGREHGEAPVPYPVACAPQAWSAASVFMLFQAILGLRIDAPASRLTLTRPQLPPVLTELRIDNIAVGEASVDLLFVRHAEDVGVTVLRREGRVEVLVVK